MTARGPDRPKPTAPEALVTVFGGSGYLGHYVVARLVEAGRRVRIAARNPGKGTPGRDPDRVERCVADVRDDASVAAALGGARSLVNAVGLYVERGAETFRAVHEEGARRVAREAARSGVERLVHISGIGVDLASPSRYVRARAAGEHAVREAFAPATILRPSVLFGPGDAFLCSLEAITRHLPVFPLFGTGATRLQPVYVDDVAEAVLRSLDDPVSRGRTYELGGPGVHTYRALIEGLLQHLGRRRILLSMPFLAWEMQAAILRFLPSPPVTQDQIELMRRDNIVGSGVGTFCDLGIEPRALEDLLPLCLPIGRASGAPG